MRFEIILAPEAVEDLRRLKANDRTAVEVLASVDKADAGAWLAEAGERP